MPKLVNLLDLADRQIGPLQLFQRAIPTGPNRPLLGQADVIFWMSLRRDCLVSEDIIMQTLPDLEKRRQDHPDRPSRPQQGPSLL